MKRVHMITSAVVAATAAGLALVPLGTTQAQASVGPEVKSSVTILQDAPGHPVLIWDEEEDHPFPRGSVVAVQVHGRCFKDAHLITTIRYDKEGDFGGDVVGTWETSDGTPWKRDDKYGPLFDAVHYEAFEKTYTLTVGKDFPAEDGWYIVRTECSYPNGSPDNPNVGHSYFEGRRGAGGSEFTVKGDKPSEPEASATPSTEPSAEPSVTPSVEPSTESSATPSVEASASSSTPSKPSVTPSELPSEPSEEPSESPSDLPSEPSETPSELPSEEPSVEASVTPSETPSAEPSVTPSVEPSTESSATPSVEASASSSTPSEPPTEPSATPSELPSEPSETPSEQPSVTPSAVPTPVEPSGQPSVDPSESSSVTIPELPSRAATSGTGLVTGSAAGTASRLPGLPATGV